MATAHIAKASKELVDALLAMNTKNRNLKDSIVEQYTRDIIAGRWRITNQGIGVSKDGILIDGQHRLAAIRDAGYPPIEVLVVYGLDEDAQKAVDQHSKRTARDIFRLFSDHGDISRMAPAIINCVHKHLTGWRGGNSLSMDEMFQKYEEHAETITAITCDLNSKTFFAAPFLAAIVHSVDTENMSLQKAKMFLSSVEIGENLTRKCPEYHLRNYIMSSKKTGGGCLIQKERFLKTKKAYEAYVDGREIGVLKV